MADAKPIVISMKMLADVTDADKLLKYVHDLGQQLKKAGGEDAESLRKKLLQIKRDIYSGDRSAQSVKNLAGQVSAMMPDIAKSKTVGSLNAINGRLAQFGTTQARIVQRTVDDIKAAVTQGDLSETTLDLLGKSLDKFVEQANKLPPVGLKKLATDIRRTIENTQELQDVIASVAGIDFKVSGGSGSLEDLAHKISVIEGAKGLDEGVKALEQALADLDPDTADEIAKSLERMRGVLKGDLGKRSVAELNAAMDALSKTASRLGGSQLGKVAEAISSVTAQGRQLCGTLGEMTERQRAWFEVAESGADELGIRTDSLTKNIIDLLTKIPGVGRAFKAVGAVGTLAITAIIWSIKKIIDTWREWRQFKAEHEFRMFGEGVKSAQRAIDAYISVLEIAQSKEKTYIDAKRQQKDAINELTKAQLELNKAKELEGVEDEAARRRIEEKYSALESEQTYKEGKLGYARKVEDEDLAIKQMEERLNLLKEKAKENREAFNYAKKKTDYYLKQGAKARRSFRFADEKFNSEQAESWSESSVAYMSDMRKNIEDIAQLESKIEEAKIRREALTKKAASGEKTPEQARLEAEKLKREAEARDRKAAEDRRIAALKRDREREQELFDYDRDLAERQHARSVAEPYQDLVTQLKTAETELRRFRAEEEEAYRTRERIMRAVALRAAADPSGYAAMTAEEQTAFNNATSDLTRARSSRYTEQSNIANLKKTLHDRRFDEGLTQYQRDKEDRDFEREGRYSRGNWASRLRMDIERYREGQRMFEDAQKRILADNAGTRPMTPEERRIAERDRDEGRAKMTETRSALRSAAMEGDSQGMSFVASLFGHRNRLTAMGLGGDVADWDRQTARNTHKLVEQNRELLNSINRKTGANLAWGL